MRVVARGFMAPLCDGRGAHMRTRIAVVPKRATNAAFTKVASHRQRHQVVPFATEQRSQLGGP
eukprot:scaffold89045_cov32-Tisochrysis_lutea.AAC.7